MKAIYILLLMLVSLSGFEVSESPTIKERVAPTGNPNAIYSYNNMLETATKSVVNISVEMDSKGINHPIFNDPFFQQFFEDFYGEMPNDRVDRAVGSGVIISSDGYIVTNYHVVENTNKVVVSLPNDKKEYVAKIIGIDPKTDLAVIKINKTNLPSASFGNSSSLKVGDVVFAIGNPFGIGESVSQGIVSALNKNIAANTYENFIQTDASINPGNSGGALIDSRGALMGINTIILSHSGANHGVGFAIPADMVKKIAKTLIEKGSVKRGYLGVSSQDVTNNLRDSYGDNEGAVIIGLDPNTPAARAGLMVWDLITHINDKKINSAIELKNAIGMLSPNEKISIKYIRDKQERITQVTLDELKDDAQAKAATPKQAAPANKQDLLGLLVADITNAKRRQLRIPDWAKGVLVTGVEPHSKARAAGFMLNDIISQVENIEIKDVNDLHRAFEKFKGKNKRILVINEMGTKTLLLK